MNAAGRALAIRGRRTLILTHRYLGIAISLVVVVWFASGIAMLYAGDMPRLDPKLRLERLAPLDFAGVRLSPAEAAGRADLAGSVPTLLMVEGRPAYRFAQPAGALTIFADDGSRLARLSAGEAAAVARRFAAVPADRVRFERQLDEVDQWTLGQRRDLPLLKFRVDDRLGTQLYVSPDRAEVVQMTTARSRTLAWIGTIPHWLYFSALRTHQTLWFRLVVWLAAFASALALLGLVLAITQFQKTRPFRLKAAIPYRGWMRWHYISGALFGVFALTWSFSGLMSMEPWGWTRAEGLAIARDALTGGPVDLGQLPAVDGDRLAALAAPAVVKEVGFVRIQGEQFYTLNAAGGGESRRPILIRANGLDRVDEFSAESIVQRIQDAVPEARIVEQALLEDYDDYYYSRGGAGLPVLRIKFDDPMRTWIYVDPATSAVVAQVHRYSRIERWLHNGLHSLDFAFWYSRRPWWDFGMIVLLLGGLASSGIGLYLGVRRLVRGAMPDRRMS